MMMDLLKQHFDTQKKIYRHFGYKEGWDVFPLSDETDKHWFLNGQVMSSRVVYSEIPFTKHIIEAGSKIFDGQIIGVYRKDSYTMVAVDCSGNKFLMVFDNAKECKDNTLIETYNECW